MTHLLCSFIKKKFDENNYTKSKISIHKILTVKRSFSGHLRQFRTDYPQSINKWYEKNDMMTLSIVKILICLGSKTGTDAFSF